VHDFDDDEDEPTHPERTLPRARVLVVEDDSRFRSIVSRRLDRDGYDVYQAATADEALAMMHFAGELGWPTDRFELVIFDNVLPGNSGLEVLRRLRAEANTTPALLMTAFPDASVIREAMACDATLLVKPFSLDHLCDATIRAILATRRAEHVA
jgi:DNA-binding response OmpR family regulator